VHVRHLAEPVRAPGPDLPRPEEAVHVDVLVEVGRDMSSSMVSRARTR
jgi:hypothetical protein